jgi:predicted membrane protein
MKNNDSRSIPSQVILGAFVIALGILFLLDNLDIWDFHRAISFWPVVFIVAGVVKLLDSASQHGKAVGAVLIGVGAVLTLGRLGYFHINWHDAWPLVIIGLGCAVVYKALAGRRAIEGSVMKVAEDSDSIVDITAILGGFDRRINTPTFRGGEVTAVMGGCQLDLRGSSIEGEAVINVFVAMGGISMKVPTDWTVILHGTPIIGGFDEKTNAAPNSTKRLIVKGYAIMGGVEIRN